MRRRWLKRLLRAENAHPEFGSWQYRLIVFSFYFQFRITRKQWYWCTPLFSIHWMWDWVPDMCSRRMQRGLFLMWFPASWGFNLPEGSMMYRRGYSRLDYGPWWNEEAA